MAEQGPVESERVSPAPGDSPRSGGSVFSADGDRTLIGIPPINLGLQMQSAHVAAPSGVPAPPPAALPSGSLFPNNEPGEEVTQAAFHRAISYQKDITDLLFDPACKVTNIQRSKIIALLRSILQECADIRAVAARQAGRVDEFRYQLARPSTASTGVPGVINPAHPVPGPSYASVLAGKHNSDQVASRMTAPSTLPPHTPCLGELAEQPKGTVVFFRRSVDLVSTRSRHVLFAAALWPRLVLPYSCRRVRALSTPVPLSDGFPSSPRNEGTTSCPTATSTAPPTEPPASPYHLRARASPATWSSRRRHLPA
ncbi:hypothetical protein HPB50_011393 [Hyalomma asiaticum]|uniref:Uncharacterized protein n=1 Tax=Hyalomma asiaticum TaxID=266040 RepID=A0ACB7S925_HYAAI|nr:hypothetical protein HPB50_011393 [Hyalomma asiaticum]